MADADTTTANPAQTADSARTQATTGDNTSSTPDGADGDRSGLPGGAANPAPTADASAAPPPADGGAVTPPDGAPADGTTPPDNSGQDGGAPAAAGAAADDLLSQIQPPPPQSTAAALAAGVPLAAARGVSGQRTHLKKLSAAAERKLAAAEAELAAARAKEAARVKARATNLARDAKKAGLADTATADEVEAAASRKTLGLGRQIERATERVATLEGRAAGAGVRAADAAAAAAGGEGLIMGGIRRLGLPIALAVSGLEIYHGYRTGGKQGAIVAAENSGISLAGAAAGALAGGAIGSVVPFIGTGIGAFIGGVAGSMASTAYGRRFFNWVMNRGPGIVARHVNDPINALNGVDNAINGRPAISPPRAPAAPAAGAKAAPPSNPGTTKPDQAKPTAAAKPPAHAGSSGKVPPTASGDNHGLGHGPNGSIHEQEFESIPQSALANLDDAHLKTALANESKTGALFDFDQAIVTPEALDVLKSQLAEIKKAGKIVLIGHTDLVGTDPYNNALSMDRANAVRNALISLGVNGDDIKIVGVGKQDAADGNNPPVIGRDPLDRRVTWAPDPTATPTPAPTNSAAPSGPGATTPATPPPPPAANTNGQDGIPVVPLLVGGAIGGAYFGGVYGGGGFDRNHHHHGDHDRDDRNCPPGMKGQPEHHWWQWQDNISRPPDRGSLRASTARDASAGIASAEVARAQAMSAFEAPQRGGSRGGMISGQNLTLGAGRGAIGSAAFGGGRGMGGMGHAGGGGGHR